MFLDERKTIKGSFYRVHILKLKIHASKFKLVGLVVFYIMVSQFFLFFILELYYYYDYYYFITQLMICGFSCSV